MTKIDQIMLLENFLAAMRKHLISKADHFPEEWDGFELRQYCADEFAREAHRMDRRRAKAYRNAIGRSGAL